MKKIGFFGLLVVFSFVVATMFFDQTAADSKTQSYSQFINDIQQGKIESVEITSDKTVARYAASDGSGRVEVNLSQAPGLIEILTENNVAITVRPAERIGPFWRLLGLFKPSAERL